MYWLCTPPLSGPGDGVVVAATSAELARARVAAEQECAAESVDVVLCPLAELRRHLGLAEPRAPPTAA